MTCHTPPTITRNIDNRLNVHFFLDSELYLGKSTEFNNQGMKVQVKRLFNLQDNMLHFIFYIVYHIYRKHKQTEQIEQKITTTWFLKYSRDIWV